MVNFVLLNGPIQIDETLEFRYKLEEYIKKKLNIPRILIVVEFNYHTLKAISNSIDDFSFLILFRVRLIHISNLQKRIKINRIITYTIHNTLYMILINLILILFWRLPIVWYCDYLLTIKSWIYGVIW